MRWKELLVGLALAVAVTAGCKEQCYLHECDRDHYLQGMGLPPNLDCNPEASLVPSGLDPRAPATVDDAEREPYYLTLNEAIALAIEHGTVGSQFINVGSTFIGQGAIQSVSNESLGSFQGSAVTLSDGIRVLALEPAVTGANIEASLAKFDARWVSTMTWQKTNTPTGGNFQQSFQNGDNASLSSQLLKPLATGGVAGITFNTTYTFLSNPPSTPGQTFTNPAYRPSLQFNFEQPLLQGFGEEINQLRASHPGSIQTNFATGGRVEGVLITRLRFDQQRAEFQRNLNFMLYNVEFAYWTLYGSYWTLYSREQGLRQAYEAWRINRDRLEAGRISRQELAQTRQQYESFRGQRITALGQVLEAERQLRALLGLPVEDGKRLVPTDTPTLAFYRPDWQSSLNDALVYRPELILARQDLKFRQLDLINQRDLLRPDLRFFSNYNINGLGSHLGGGPNDPENALASLASNQFHDWTLGLRMDVPIGFRDAHSAVRVARLRLSQSYLSLRDQEMKAKSFLAQQYRLLDEFYNQIEAQRAQRDAAAVALESRLKEYLAGRIILDILLQAQQAWANALSSEFEAVTQYNNTLARFEFAKGTIMQHDNVVIAEGPLPQCAQVRAVDHERERQKAIVLRERAAPVNHPACCYDKGNAGLPELPTAAPPSIPSLYETAPPIPDAADGPSARRPIQTLWKRLHQAPVAVPDVQPASAGRAPASKDSTGAAKAQYLDGMEEMPVLKRAGAQDPPGGLSAGPGTSYLPTLPVYGGGGQGQVPPGPAPVNVPDRPLSEGRTKLLWRIE